MRMSFPCESRVDLYAVHSAVMSANIPGVTGVSRDYDVLHVEIPFRDALTDAEAQAIEQMIEAHKAIPSWDEVRRARQPLLLEADWRIERALDLGDDAAELRAYRQTLRDVTKQPDPHNVAWPAKPWRAD